MAASAASSAGSKACVSTLGRAAAAAEIALESSPAAVAAWPSSSPSSAMAAELQRSNYALLPSLGCC